MHDAKALIKGDDEVVSALSRRGYELDLPLLRQLVEKRADAIQRVDALRAEGKILAGRTKGSPEADRRALRDAARNLKADVRRLEGELRECEQRLQDLMLEIPNVPDARTPNGDTGDFAEPLSYEGDVPTASFEPKDHAELGQSLGILDLQAATSLSGQRFSVMSGVGAALERALVNFFIDIHTSRYGYTEKSVPVLVTPQAMTATGQLPRFRHQLFATQVDDRELFLVPTGEVPLTNLYANSNLDEAELPVALTAHTQCFRSEAGSYGRDMHGLIRLHQFSKIELVRICRPEDSDAELGEIVGAAQTCLRELALPHRVVRLAAGDTGFAAEMTYDLEVWFPAQGIYREISSCSAIGQFQARRANIRYRDSAGRRRFAATLNGSALPIGRTIAAILENYQQRDGSVRIPKALVPYLGAEVLEPVRSIQGGSK
jgi:seryl-tRNA synthetase